MELRQLEYFVAVVEESNFTRAAARVHISQSGVSAQIRALEHEPGAQLIDRSGRTATLTAAGEAALGHARSALASARAVRTAVDEVNGLVRGRLAVGTVASCTFEPLFDALASFHAEHPGVEVTLVEDSSDRLLDQVRSGVLEIALVGMPASGTAAPASLTPSMLPTPGPYEASGAVRAGSARGQPPAARRALTRVMSPSSGACWVTSAIAVRIARIEVGSPFALRASAMVITSSSVSLRLSSAKSGR